jgi:predicted CXXCH cytochrome family protein
VKDGADLCYGCRQEEQAFGRGKSHSALKDDAKGRAGCLGCHNPHAGPDKGLLKASGNGLCFGCHKQQAFAKKVKHAPDQQNCRTCHEAHASPDPEVLVKHAKRCARTATGRRRRSSGAHGGYPMRTRRAPVATPP